MTFCGQKLKLPLYEIYGSQEQVELSINQFNANQYRNELELGLRAIQLKLDNCAVVFVDSVWIFSHASAHWG